MRLNPCGRILCVVILVAVAAATGSLAENGAKAGLVPGSVSYGLDRFGERVRLSFTFSSEKIAQLYLQYADERLAELETINSVFRQNGTCASTCRST